MKMYNFCVCYLLKQTVLVYCWFTYIFFPTSAFTKLTVSFLFFLSFHFKVTVSRTILGLDVTLSRNHPAVKYHDPAIAHLLCPV